jgi:ribulose-5-phosphate 4-epimerase/fuculose-1-phosphate aldolase
MAMDGMVAPLAPSLKDRVSPEEWQARVDLAALYRIVAMYGWDDLVFTHISARVPGPEHHFLINPYGYLFEEMTASMMVKVDLDGKIVDPSPFRINPAGFTIHSAIHAAREDAHWVMHLHTDQGVGVSAQPNGLLPISQHASLIINTLAYHDYEGVALDLDERERIVKDMGENNLLMLRNHGTLAVGDTAGGCFTRMFYLERACKMQIMAQAGGEVSPIGDNVLGKARGRTGGGVGSSRPGMQSLVWPALLRKLDREMPGYDT